MIVEEVDCWREGDDEDGRRVPLSSPVSCSRPGHHCFPLPGPSGHDDVQRLFFGSLVDWTGSEFPMRRRARSGSKLAHCSAEGIARSTAMPSTEGRRGHTRETDGNTDTRKKTEWEE